MNHTKFFNCSITEQFREQIKAYSAFLVYDNAGYILNAFAAGNIFIIQTGSTLK